ncbi:MAG: hypothetical protein IT361_13800 [Gemmatimonadaceae bacterium]|nr:hypothetical protein [Gemmatimonadaceae bacterium]
MSKVHMAAGAVAAAVLWGCTEVEQPVRPPIPTGIEAAVSAPMSVGPAAISGFHFYPPIAATPPVGIRPDATVLDLLAVEICEWNGTACVLPLVRRITSTSDSRERLALVENTFYRAVWITQSDGLDPAKTYRVRVLASGGELGYADVNVLGPREEPDRSGQVRLPLGAPLPIKFAIAQGTGGRVGIQGGTVTLTSGISLVVPPGAVRSDVFITAAPATNLPPAHLPLVPGTGWDFAPDGLSFMLPATMTIPYDPAQLPPNVNEADLRIHKLVNGAYVQQNAGRVDVVNHTVSAEVNGFSVYVIIPRNPQTPQDVLPPRVRALEVLDPVTGTYGNAVTLSASSADAALTMRVSLTDDIAGVSFIDIRWVSPTGRQLRFPCFTGAPPTSGSDTNGEWVCQSTVPRYAESGLWVPQIVWLHDKVRNSVIYGNTQNGLCTTGSAPPDCVASVPRITINSAPDDVAPPVVSSLAVSLDVQPRMFAPSVSVDAAAGARIVQFGFLATDNLAGLGNFVPFDFFGFVLLGPSGQTPGFQFVTCTMTSGSSLNGFWECPVLIPAQAEAGVWKLQLLRVPDRAGNGGWSGASDFRDNGNGQLCNPGGNCIPSPTVVVTSTGDARPPDLQTVNIASNGPDVTTTLGVIDNLSGVNFLRVQYWSTQTTQFQECFPARFSGTPTNGTWQCTITFSSLAARGQWVLQVQAIDVAGNIRWYSRRSTDGFLCYVDPGQQQVCQDFGTTDIILP